MTSAEREETWVESGETSEELGERLVEWWETLVIRAKWANLKNDCIM